MSDHDHFEAAARAFLRALATLADDTPDTELAEDVAAVHSAAWQLLALHQPPRVDAPVPHAEPAQ